MHQSERHCVSQVNKTQHYQATKTLLSTLTSYWRWSQKSIPYIGQDTTMSWSLLLQKDIWQFTKIGYLGDLTCFIPHISTLSSSKNPWTAIGPTLGRNGPLGGQPSWRVVLMAVSDMMKVELDYCCAGQFNNWQDGSVGDLNQWLAMRLARWDLRSSQLFCSMVMNESGVLLWNNQTRRSVPMILRDDGPMRKTIAFIGLPLQWKTDHGVAAFQSCPHILRSQIR